jgi:hypothetical protein
MRKDLGRTSASALSLKRSRNKISNSFEHAIDLDQAIVVEAEILLHLFFETKRPYPPEISQGLIRIFNLAVKNAECIREVQSMTESPFSEEYSFELRKNVSEKAIAQRT